MILQQAMPGPKPPSLIYRKIIGPAELRKRGLPPAEGKHPWIVSGDERPVARITANIIGEMKRQDVQSCDAAEELVESDDFGAFLHSYEEVMRASIRRRIASDRDFDPARWKSAAKLLQ